MSDLSTLDSILAGGGQTAKFETPGDTYAGEIDQIEVRQVNDYDTGKPSFWDDGKPQEQIIVTIQTSEQRDADDDGKRNIFIKGWGDPLKAFRQAAKTLGRNPRPGDIFTATYTGDGEKKNPRFNAPKRFQYEIQAGAAGLSTMTGQQPAEQAQAAPQQAPAPQRAAGQQGAGDASEKAKQLIQLGLTDDVIAQQLGMDTDVIAMLRSAL